MPGSSTSPTAYAEGIYVSESERHRGVASRLVDAGATFAARHGCIELASDTELENEDSQRFHEKVGFKEVERVASYIKNLSHENRERGLIDVLILQRGLASLLRFQQLP